MISLYRFISLYLGVPSSPSADGWVVAKDGQKYKKRKIEKPIAPLPPFAVRTPKPEKFSDSFLKEKTGRAKSKKCRENFSVLGRKLLQSLRAEAGRRLNRIFEKSSSFVQDFRHYETFRFLSVNGVLARSAFSVAKLATLPMFGDQIERRLESEKNF